jgi:polyisoprenoid-binding protein YceI
MSGGDDYEDDHDHDHGVIVELPAGTWRVDAGGSEVAFTARTLLGLVPVRGIFASFHGELLVAAGGASSGTLVVETASIQTGLARRDRDLRGHSYFDVERCPEMSFTLEQITPAPQRELEVTGTLEVCGRQIALSFRAQAIAHGDHLHIEGGVSVDHELAGLGWARPGLVSSRVRAQVALTLIPA